MKNSSDLLSTLITPQVALALVPAFTAAYSIAIDTSTSVDFLSGELRSQILPHLKNWALEFEIKRRSDKGLIPFQCEFVSNKAKNHRHIELKNDNWRITVSQVCRSTDIPRESIFRNKYSLDGQISFPSFGFDDDIDYASGRVYAILTHGWQTTVPSFINCGIPSSDMKFWVQHLNVLDILQGMTANDPLPPNEDIKLEFKRHANEMVSDLSEEA